MNRCHKVQVLTFEWRHNCFNFQNLMACICLLHDNGEKLDEKERASKNYNEKQMKMLDDGKIQIKTRELRKWKATKIIYIIGLLFGDVQPPWRCFYLYLYFNILFELNFFSSSFLFHIVYNFSLALSCSFTSKCLSLDVKYLKFK